MADNAEKPNRSQADKDRSRQQSRAVSGKEAAKGVAGQPGKGQRSSPKAGAQKGAAPVKGQPSTNGAGKGTGAKSGAPAKGQRARRPGAGATTTAPRRSSTALLTWGIVGLVLIIVIVFVVVKVTSSSPSPSAAPASQPLPAAVAHDVTNIPASVYDSVGVTSPTVPVSPPKVVTGQPLLTFGGKPGFFYMGGEFCPFCAAQRWAIAASLSRFGKFTGLRTMQSSATDRDPNTQTLTFAQADFSSSYIAAQLREYYSNKPNSAGTGYTILQPLTKSQSALVSKYDTAKYTGGSTTASGSIPFINIGNKVLAAGASFTPTVLQGLSRRQIAGDLTNASNPVTQAIVATSNYMSASICAIDGGQPASVCTSKGVTAGAKALDLKS